MDGRAFWMVQCVDCKKYSIREHDSLLKKRIFDKLDFCFACNDKRDIKKLSKLIEACAYNPEVNVMAFRHNNVRIVAEKKRIVINDIETEVEVRAIMDWLSTLASTRLA